MKSSFGNPLDKKVPESKKYAHVQSSLDTGASAKKQGVISTSAAAKRRDEIFKRIRPATLVRLLQEREVCESVYAMGPDMGDGRSSSSVMASKAATTTAAPTSVVSASVLRKTGSIIMSGKVSVCQTDRVGSVAGSVLSVVDSDATVDDTRDLVLLDLREPDEFERCRLPLAVNYPAAKVNRDQFSPELLSCKRNPSKLLVVYHNSDQTTCGVATLLVQKGWEVVHVLTGGFEEMIQSYPEMLDGEIPDRPATSSTVRSSRAGRRT